MRAEEFFDDRHIELYNLKDDLSEQHDLAQQIPDKANQLRDKLHAWRKAVNAQMPTPNPPHHPSPGRHTYQDQPGPDAWGGF